MRYLVLKWRAEQALGKDDGDVSEEVEEMSAEAVEQAEETTQEAANEEIDAALAQAEDAAKGESDKQGMGRRRSYEFCWFHVFFCSVLFRHGNAAEQKDALNSWVRGRSCQVQGPGGGHGAHGLGAELGPLHA